MTKFEASKFETSDCCCGCDVKLGTTILVWLDIVCLAVLLCVCGTNSLGFFAICVLLLGLSISGLYGIHQIKPLFLVPYFILRILMLILFCIFGGIFIFCGGIGLQFTSSATTVKSDYQTFTYNSGFTDSIKSYFIILIVIGVCLIIMEIHFLRVVYTCIKKLEIESGTSWNGAVLSVPRTPTVVTNQTSSDPFGLPDYKA